LTITYDDDGIEDATRDVDKFKGKFQKLSKDLDKSSSGISRVWMSIAKSIGIAALALGALGGGIQLVAGLSSVVAALAGAVAILPGAFAGLGVIIGVLALAKDGFKELGKQLADLKPKFDDLKLSVQKTLFAGVADEIRSLAKQYLPLLKTGLNDVARSLNAAAFEVTGFFKASSTQKDVARLFDLTSQTINNMRLAIKPLLAAFTDIGIVGSGVFEQITRNIGTAAQKFAEWIGGLRASGELEEWMLGGVEALKQVIKFLLAVGGIINQVFQAFDSAGVDFLGTLVQVTSGILDFMKSVEGQEVLQTFAQALKDIGGTVGQFLIDSLKALAPVLKEALPAFAKLIAALAEDLLPVIQAVAPLLENIAIFIGQHPDAVAKALVALGAIALAFKVAAGAAAILSAVLAVNPYVLLAAAVVALAVLIVVYWDEIVAFLKKAHEKIVEFSVGSWNKIKSDAQAIWQAILDFFKMIGQALYDATVQPIIDLAVFLSGVWRRIVEETSAFFTPIIDVIKGIFEIMYTIIDTVMQLIGLLIQRAWQDIQTFTSTVWNAIVAVLHAVFDPIVAWWSGLWNTIKDFIVSTNQAIGDFVSQKWEQIKNFIMSIFGPIVQWFRDIWNRVSGSANDGVNSVMSFITGLPGRIMSAVAGAGQWLYSVGRDVVIGFLNGVRDMVGRAVAEVKAMASNIIAGAKSILGIASPSKVFKLFGEYTMEGYIVGVQGMFNPVMDTMAAVAQGIVDRGTVPPIVINPAVGMTSATTGAATSESAVQPVVIQGPVHLHVAGNLDPTKPVQFRQTIIAIDEALSKIGSNGRENK
jgi:phage-related protein